MTEPLFFDCLTDAQFWSLFDTGVLQGYLLPVEVYERLERIAPDHDSYLFTWPRDVVLPSLHDLVPDLVVPGEAPPAPPHSNSSETRVTVERMRLAIEAFCMRGHIDMPLEGGRIHVISTNPRPELRVGPYLQSQARDLNAMSLPELEAYLDDVLWVDEGHEVDSGASSAKSPP
jgi:hypothetical protein